jgi:tungstate transport system ATP-binding protein
MNAPLYQLEKVRVIRGGRPILEVESLELPEGDFTAVVGPNGAGKTTLLRLLAFLVRPDAGTLFFRGKATRGPAESPAVRRGVTLVMQDPYLFSGSVLSNARYGLRVRGVRGEEASARAREALDRMGILHLADRKAATLSGGEGKRLAVARALATEPEVLLLDEPTADVDRENRARMEDVIRTLSRETDMAVILSTHDEDQAGRLASRVLSLDAGKISVDPHPS